MLKMDLVMGDFEEEFKEVLKGWAYGTWDRFSCWGWFGG